MSPDSPWYLGSNTLNHLAESIVGSSRNAIKVDLVNKIIYDDPAVFRHQRIDQVNNDFVAVCVTSFKAANTEDIKLLKALTEQALKKMPEVMEFEEIKGRASDSNKVVRSVNHGSAEEMMYVVARHVSRIGDT